MVRGVQYTLVALLLLLLSGCIRQESPISPQEAKINGTWTETFTYVGLSSTVLTDPNAYFIHDTITVNITFAGNGYDISFSDIGSEVSARGGLNLASLRMKGTFRVEKNILYLRQNGAEYEEKYNYKQELSQLYVTSYAEKNDDGTIAVQLAASLWGYTYFKHSGILQLQNR